MAKHLKAQQNFQYERAEYKILFYRQNQKRRHKENKKSALMLALSSKGNLFYNVCITKLGTSIKFLQNGH